MNGPHATKPRFGLQARLTAFVLAVVIPPAIALFALFAAQADQQLRTIADERLQTSTQALAQSVSSWMEMNERALSELIDLPGIERMDPVEQKPILEAMAAAYPHMYLVSTTDLEGINIARNDDAEPKDYSDRAWFQGAAAGNPLTFQTLVGRTSGEPALVASMPIVDSSDAIIGVGMYATDLNIVSEQVRATRIGETGFAYVVNELGQVLAHPDPTYAAELRNLALTPPVASVLAGKSGPILFTDDAGTQWISVVAPLDQGWGVVVQQQQNEVLSAVRSFQRFALLGVVGTIAAILVLTLLVTRQILRPVGAMTDAALAISQGDLNRTVPVQTRDELGMLAKTFNTMTGQLRGSIAGLEHRVAERTEGLAQYAQELEASNRQNQRRASQLEASAQVARAVASVLNMDQLLNQVVHLISDRFGHYHTGIFLLDDTGRWAALRAANSQGGQRMLSRGHRLRVGEQGIVGYVAETGRPRVALDVGADAVFFNNPDLPETRSEIALPLVARNQIIGALDVQSKEPNAFDELDVVILRALADQVAVALDNARLFEASQAALRQAETIQQQYIREAWEKHLGQRETSFFEFHELSEAPGTPQVPEAEQVLADGKAVITAGGDGRAATVAVPIKVRDQVIGALGLRESSEAHHWSSEEVELIETVADQVAQAMEAARLFNETQRRAQRERLVSEISDKIRTAGDVEDIMRVTVQEIRHVLGATHGAIRLGTESHLLPPAEDGEGGD